MLRAILRHLRRLGAIGGWPPVGFIGAFALILAVIATSDRAAGERFDLPRWERTSFANKWLFALGRPFRNDPDGDEAIARYFALRDRDGTEGRRLENVIEAAIEGRLDAALRELRVSGRFDLFGGVSVFPPVDVELAASPEALVVSPREVIERRRVSLLRPGLRLARAEAIEREVERDESLSALVVPTGGLSVYPAVVDARMSYRGTVRAAAHEWVHHYLSFYPLGLRYFRSREVVTINETVADIVAEEVAALVLERFDNPRPAGAAAGATPTPEPGRAAEVARTLRGLRLEVDELLAHGRIDEAERLMEEARRRLSEQGVRIRRLNQAYFAWYGTYAARPDAVDPLGPQLRELRQRAGSLAAFLALVRDFDSRADVERALARLGG
ncbi:MAG: hypothetical protein FJZ92_11920 [Chloroflexi bacterium]|nr:hypothetical protein [Chloroflexota bacterium]